MQGAVLVGLLAAGLVAVAPAPPAAASVAPNGTYSHHAVAGATG